MSIGEALNRYRERAMLTQEELGERAGVSGYTVSRIEGDHVEPRFSTVRKLARALGVDPAELWSRKEEESPKATAPSASGQPDSADLKEAAKKAVRSLSEVADISSALPAYWNAEVEEYVQDERELPPYRSFEMLCTADRLYEDFHEAFATIQRDAAAEGHPNPATWDSETKTMFLGTGAKLRALGELARRIHAQRSAGSSPVALSQEDARAIRMEFDASPPKGLPSGPEWSSALDEARAAAGIT